MTIAELSPTCRLKIIRHVLENLRTQSVLRSKATNQKGNLANIDNALKQLDALEKEQQTKGSEGNNGQEHYHDV